MSYLYNLYVQALASFSRNYKVSSLHPLIAQLSSFLPYCGLSYVGLITGSDVDKMNIIAFGGKLISAAILLP